MELFSQLISRRGKLSCAGAAQYDNRLDTVMDHEMLANLVDRCRSWLDVASLA